MRHLQEAFTREPIIYPRDQARDTGLYSREEPRDGGLYFREEAREGGLYTREEAREGGLYPREEVREGGLYDRGLFRCQTDGLYLREEGRGEMDSLYARPHGLAGGLYAPEDGPEELPLELTKHSAEERLPEDRGPEASGENFMSVCLIK